MDPFFAHAQERIEAAFRAHERMFDMMHARTMGVNPYQRFSNESYSNSARQSEYPQRSRQNSNSRNLPVRLKQNQDYIPSRASGRRQSTLAREGINPSYKSTRCATPRDTRDTNLTGDQSNGGREILRNYIRIGNGWYQVTPYESGLMSSQGSYSTVKCSLRQLFLVVFEPRVRETKRACLSSQAAYEVGFLARCSRDAYEQCVHLVLGYKEVDAYCSSDQIEGEMADEYEAYTTTGDYFLVTIDISQQRAALLYCVGTEPTAVLPPCANLLCQTSFGEQIATVKPNHDFAVKVSVRGSDVTVRIDDSEVIQYDLRQLDSTTNSSSSSDLNANIRRSLDGFTGLLTSSKHGQQFMIKDWRMVSLAPNNNGNQAIATSSSGSAAAAPRAMSATGKAGRRPPLPGPTTTAVASRCSTPLSIKRGTTATTGNQQPQTIASTFNQSSSSVLERCIGSMEKQKNYDRKLLESVLSDVIQEDLGVSFDDIAGADGPKQILNEAVVLPLLVPELFTGLRHPWKGVLLFGPPGTGKTMLARAAATAGGNDSLAALSGTAPAAKDTNHRSTGDHANPGSAYQQQQQQQSTTNSGANTCSVTLVSKWHGESEKLVKCLFDAARAAAPAIIFLDEIDALVSTRGSSGEHEASRRLKSQLLCQMDGIVAKSTSIRSGTSASSHGQPQQQSSNQVMVLAATNCPWDLDAALLRRLEKRIYVPLPDFENRVAQFARVLAALPMTQVGGDIGAAATSSAPNAPNATASVADNEGESNDQDGKDTQDSQKYSYLHNACQRLARLTDGFSGADIHVASREASMASMRKLMQQKSLVEIQQLRSQGLLETPEVSREDSTYLATSTKYSSFVTFLFTCIFTRPQTHMRPSSTHDTFVM
mmetsp:Transcript_12952/g.21709  ORF Transcript_12952/g.21709 Transcript_12952/m.21709 type:complete len:879 (-) Transcript_12952:338-2974(-)